MIMLPSPGERVYPTYRGDQARLRLGPGQYGRLTPEGPLLVRLPTGEALEVSWRYWSVTEHEDGTVTVLPRFKSYGYVGCLVQGYWFTEFMIQLPFVEDEGEAMLEDEL